MEIKPTLSFDFDITLYEEEVRMKGYCGNVNVLMPDLSRYKISFYDPIRLKQDVEDENYIAEPGLIVLTDVTKQNMEKAVYELWLDGYFEELKPLNL